MTLVKLSTAMAGLILLGSLSACNRGDVLQTCDEPQPYQLIVESKRVVVPDGLDPLDELKEIPIPKSDSPERPEGSKCIDFPPVIRSSSKN